MMKKIATTNPLHDPSVFMTMTSVMNEIRRGIMYDMDCCRPAIVEEYNRDTHVVGVRPLVKHVDFEGNATSLPVQWMTLQRVQIGGFLIDIPVHVGDVGWMVATDRNAETAKHWNNKIQGKDTCKLKDGRMAYGEGNQGPQAPGQYDMHSFLTGFFIPDSWAKIKIPQEYKDHLLIQTVDSNGKSEGRIAMSPDGEIVIESEESGGKDKKKGLKIRANVDAKGDAKQDGKLSVTQSVHVGSDEQIEISDGDIGGNQKAKFREVRFATGERNGRLCFQKAYVLSTEPSDDGKMDVGSDTGDVTQAIMENGGGDGEAVEYTVQSGSNSNITFSVDGGEEKGSLKVDSDLSGKTVSLNVYYV